MQVNMQYWLLKTEPEVFGWEDLLREGQSHWDGVRNYAARNHLKSMKVGDLGLMYYSGKDRAIVGIVKIAQEAYPDPTTDDDRWVAVGIVPERLLPRHVTLDEVKGDPELSGMVLLKIARLSVQPVTKAEFDRILQRAGDTGNG